MFKQKTQPSFPMLLQRQGPQNRMTEDQGVLSFPLVQAHSHSCFKSDRLLDMPNRGKKKKQGASDKLRDRLTTSSGVMLATSLPSISSVFTNPQSFL